MQVSERGTKDMNTKDSASSSKFVNPCEFKDIQTYKDLETWLKKKYCYGLEIFSLNLKKATSAVAYSWILKARITKCFAGNPENLLDIGCGGKCG